MLFLLRIQNISGGGDFAHLLQAAFHSLQPFFNVETLCIEAVTETNANQSIQHTRVRIRCLAEAIKIVCEMCYRCESVSIVVSCDLRCRTFCDVSSQWSLRRLTVIENVKFMVKWRLACLYRHNCISHYEIEFIT